MREGREAAHTPPQEGPKVQGNSPVTTRGEPPISYTRGRDQAGSLTHSLSPQYKSGHAGRDRGSLPSY